MKKIYSHKTRLTALAIGVTAALLPLSGCGVGTTNGVSTPVAVAGVKLQGSVFGGQQPVGGATMQLYAANSAGYGSGSYALLTSNVTTNNSGGFSITGDYTCPTSNSLVYITATGGTSNGMVTNPNLALMAALGACGSLTSSTFINMNELTTVASVYALAPFMSGYTSVGTSATNATGLTNAFASVNKLVDIASGTVPGTALPSGATVSLTELNTLGDIIAACVNSIGGVAGDGSACGKLFSYTTPTSGAAPTDTIGAALNIARSPAQNVPSLISLITASAPFQPTLSSAADFTLSIKYTGVGLSSPSASAVDQSGNVWVTNSGNSTLTVLSTSGVPLTGSPFTGGGLSAPSGVAIDAGGNAWVADKGSSQLSVFTSSGVGTRAATTGLNAPSAVSIDAFGVVWLANSGNSSVTAVATSGTVATNSNSFTTGGINTPVAIAINPH